MRALIYGSRIAIAVLVLAPIVARALDYPNVRQLVEGQSAPATFSLTATLVPQGTTSRLRPLRGHIEGKVSVNPDPGQFEIRPSSGCSIVTTQVGPGAGISPVGTHNSRYLGMGVVSGSLITVNYVAEGCHGLMGISCGYGYMNLDFDLVQQCPVALEAYTTTVATVGTEEADGGVSFPDQVIQHPDCSGNPCTIQDMFWKATLSRPDGGRACFLVGGEPPSGQCDYTEDRNSARIQFRRRP